ncbi:MAG: hypothetical protein ABSF47_03945 [Minisyncoccia bacterium]|jgi:hypothetical protein
MNLSKSLQIFFPLLNPFIFLPWLVLGLFIYTLSVPYVHIHWLPAFFVYVLFSLVVAWVFVLYFSLSGDPETIRFLGSLSLVLGYTCILILIAGAAYGWKGANDKTLSSIMNWALVSGLIFAFTSLAALLKTKGIEAREEFELDGVKFRPVISSGCCVNSTDAYHCPNIPVFEAVLVEARVLCCADVMCKRMAAKVALRSRPGFRGLRP